MLKCLFGCLQFSQKMNENNLTCSTVVVKSNFFVRLLGELKITKRNISKLTDFQNNFFLPVGQYNFGKKYHPLLLRISRKKEIFERMIPSKTSLKKIIKNGLLFLEYPNFQISCSSTVFNVILPNLPNILEKIRICGIIYFKIVSDADSKYIGISYGQERRVINTSITQPFSLL